MVFNELREAIVTRLKEAMPKEVDVAGHPGVIDTAELGRLCMAAPALRVSVLKVLGVDRARGNDAAELQIGVYIVAGAGKGGVGADEVALSILPRVLAVVNGENWNLQCVENRPENISADNLFDGSLPGLSGGRLVSLWGVAWRQRVIMPPLIDFTAPDRSRRRKGSRAVERSARGVPAARAQAQNRAGRNRRTAYLLRRHHRRERRKP